jgi:hypothetical protein
MDQWTPPGVNAQGREMNRGKGKRMEVERVPRERFQATFLSDF